MEAIRRADSRNRRMDFYKGVAIYGVIGIHVLFPGALGEGVRTLARFGVPFFFLTAGYFSLNAPPGTLARRALRTLKQLLWACLPYLLLGCALAAQKGEDVGKWLKGLWTWDNWKEFFMFHSVPFPYAWQMWFLGALVVVYLLWWLITKLSWLQDRPAPYDVWAAVGAILLGLHLLAGEGAALLGLTVDNRLLRNALMDGFPFFALGAWAAHRRREIKAAGVPWHWLILGGGLLSLAEARFVGRQELYLGTVVLLCGLMGRCIRYRRAPRGKLSRALQYCGRTLTLHIFALHMLVLALIRELPFLNWLEGLTWLLPLVVAALSTLAALGVVRVQNILFRPRRTVS